MKPVLQPLTFERAAEVITLTDKIIKDSLYTHEPELTQLRKQRPFLKENLVEYIIIGSLDDKYCYPSISNPDLPDWLKQFLLDCYVQAHNSLAS